MGRADRSKVIDLFETDVEEIVTPTTRMANKTKPKQEKGKANENNKARFLLKLEAEQYNEFDYKDWFQYFVHKAQSQGVRYITRNYAKEYAIIKSILNEMSWVDLKNMIDFVFDSPQDIVDKRTVGLWVLSKGWINSIFQNTQLWINGKYKPKSAPLHNREWVAEASSKKSGTGLVYGKPLKDEDEEIESSPTPKKKSVKIRF